MKYQPKHSDIFEWLDATKRCCKWFWSQVKKQTDWLICSRAINSYLYQPNLYIYAIRKDKVDQYITNRNNISEEKYDDNDQDNDNVSHRNDPDEDVDILNYEHNQRAPHKMINNVANNFGSQPRDVVNINNIIGPQQREIVNINNIIGPQQGNGVRIDRNMAQPVEQVNNIQNHMTSPYRNVSNHDNNIILQQRSIFHEYRAVSAPAVDKTDYLKDIAQEEQQLVNNQNILRNVSQGNKRDDIYVITNNNNNNASITSTCETSQASMRENMGLITCRKRSISQSKEENLSGSTGGTGSPDNKKPRTDWQLYKFDNI